MKNNYNFLIHAFLYGGIKEYKKHANTQKQIQQYIKQKTTKNKYSDFTFFIYDLNNNKKLISILEYKHQQFTFI